MPRSPLLPSRSLIAAWVVIGLLGLAAGGGTWVFRERVLLENLAVHAQTAAVAFDDAELQRLSGSRRDLGTADYGSIKSRLRRLRRLDARLRFAYLFRVEPGTGRVVFLADSAEPGTRDESLPGDPYPQAPVSPGLQRTIRTGRPATEGPLADDFGTWVTGYAAISEGASAAGAAPRHVVGLDIEAAGWRRELGAAALLGSLLIWIGLGMPWLAWMVIRRRREQDELIRNLSEAMEQSHSAILIIDRSGLVLHANRGLCGQVGYARQELIGHDWREIHAAGAAGAGREEIVASIRAGQPWEGEWTCRRKDGGLFPVRGGFSPVKNDDGRIACFVAVFDDVSDTKAREAQLREATELAQAGDRAKGHFLATMSHEVRTPLNGIVGFTSLLMETPLSAEQREYVQTIRMSTEALIQLTGDILDFARIESGKLKLDPIPCDPRDCIEDALDLLAAKAGEKGLELLHRADPDVPAAVLVDSGRLRQVLFNLVGNAVKFTEHGEVEVTVSCRPAAAPGPTPGADRAEGEPAWCALIFAVRDTGIGIAAEHHPRLFRAFSQVDDSTTRRYGGTGLGLAISRNLVGLMGGEIGLSSRPGEGSTFTFSIQVPVVGAATLPHDFGGRALLLAAPPGPVRRELARLLREWRGRVQEIDSVAELPAGGWEVALIEVTEALARQFAERTEPLPGWSLDRMIGLVPISLSNELRGALRRHFRLLVNKPVHHDALFTLLSGAMARDAGLAEPPVRYGLRVLVVEDNVVNQRLTLRMLETLGCRPTLVENGRAAIDLLVARGEEYDLMLLDMHMPEMDGLATLSVLRAGGAGPEVQQLPVIALTADAREQRRAEAMAAGLRGYLAKPLKMADLEREVRRLRDERGVRPA